MESAFDTNNPERKGHAAPSVPIIGETRPTGACQSPSTDEAVPSGSAGIAAGKVAFSPIGPMTDHLASLIEARALDPELLVMRGVGSSDRQGGDWIAIPYFEGGVRVGTKHRTLGERKSFSQDQASRQILYNIDCLSDPTLVDDPLIVTEGEMDAFAAMQAGYARVVSVPGGAPAEQLGEDRNAKKYACLDAAESLLRDVKVFILAADGDGPGVNLMHDLAARLGKSRCKWLKYPKGCKDLNDALRLYGEKGVHETIRRAQWYPVPGIYRMADLPPPVEQPALSIGIEGFGDGSDDQPTIMARRGDLWLVTGIPGHGKTSAVNETCCRLAHRHGWSTTFASFEQQPQSDHRRALRSFHAGKAQCEMTPEEIDRADAWIHRHFSFMVPSDDDDADLAWVLERCAVAVRQFGADVLVIDPWNEMDHVRPPDMTLTEYTGFAIKQFKRFARKHNVLMIVVAHPAKLQRSRDTGKYPMPSLYDISDSAHWANKPDIGVVVHRESLAPDGGSKIRIAKVRYHGVIGVPGDIDGLFWNRRTTRYERRPEPAPTPTSLPYRDT